MQLEIDFEAGLTQQYPSLMDVVNAVARNCGRPLKAVAADMDLTQSDLSRKLAENPEDTRRLAVRELPLLIEACGDRGKDIIYWLIEKYIEDPARRQDRARELFMQLAPELMRLMKDMQEHAGHGE